MKKITSLITYLLISTLLFTGCKKEKAEVDTPMTNSLVLETNKALNSDIDFLLIFKNEVKVDWGDGNLVTVKSEGNYGTYIGGKLKAKKITIHFSDAKDITGIYSPGIGLTSIDIRALTALIQLSVFKNDLKSIATKNNVNLSYVDISENNISKAPLDGILNDLPQRSKDKKGTVIIRLKEFAKERNATPSDAAKSAAETKEWKVLDYKE